MCFDCVNRLLSDLRTIGELWPAILERRVTGERGPIGKGRGVGLSPIAEGRKSHMEAARNALGGWMREFRPEMREKVVSCVCEPYRPCQGWRWVEIPDEVPAWCDWLVRHVPEMRSHPAAGELITDVSACWHTVTRLVDIPPDKALVGTCPICGEWLYADPDAIEVVCRKCRVAGVQSAYLVKESRKAMLAQAKPYRGTPIEVARLVRVSTETLRSWIRKGWLDKDGAGHVEVGQALLLAETMAERVEQARQVS